MIDAQQFRTEVVQPVLKELGLHSDAAEELVVGTAAHESGLTHLKQIGGPALGICQMEPATHDDIWDNYLKYRPEKVTALRALFGAAAGDARHLTWNLGYAVAMCRIHYCRVPAPLPDADILDDIAMYWKEHYNTSQGRGTVEKFKDDYHRIIGG